jgi:hypothetical protein
VGSFEGRYRRKMPKEGIEGMTGGGWRRDSIVVKSRALP